jgi:hypothetical protein
LLTTSLKVFFSCSGVGIIRNSNALVAQLFYIQISTSAMRAVTHQTMDFLPGIVYQAIFLGMLALFAHEPSIAPKQETPDGGISGHRQISDNACSA